jgi:acetylornithine/N-succinyldiaminopimelate aminotransferase
MSLASISRMEAKLLLPTYERQPILFVRGRGVYLWDSEGKRYLDFLSGIGVNALGHNHPRIQAVIKRQAARLIHVSNLFFHEYQAELAEMLTEISGLDRAFFCNSGTEAWEGALKLARAFAQTNNTNGGKSKSKTRILAMGNSFHGRTFGALATTGQPKYRAPFVPLVPGVTFVKFNDLDDLQRKVDSSVCAVCIETIQGEGGICPVNKEFLELASSLTKKNGALLLLDEIQCGLGRTGRHFAYQHYGVLPDVVTVAKPLACGLPLGAILTTKRVASCIHPGMHGTTFGGGPLACAVAIEFLREEKKLLKHVRTLGEYFHAALETLDKKYKAIQDVRGVGLMQAVELDSP